MKEHHNDIRFRKCRKATKEHQECAIHEQRFIVRDNFDFDICLLILCGKNQSLLRLCTTESGGVVESKTEKGETTQWVCEANTYTCEITRAQEGFFYLSGLDYEAGEAIRRLDPLPRSGSQEKRPCGETTQWVCGANTCTREITRAQEGFLPFWARL